MVYMDGTMEVNGIHLFRTTNQASLHEILNSRDFVRKHSDKCYHFQFSNYLLSNDVNFAGDLTQFPREKVASTIINQ